MAINKTLHSFLVSKILESETEDIDLRKMVDGELYFEDIFRALDECNLDSYKVWSDKSVTIKRGSWGEEQTEWAE